MHLFYLGCVIAAAALSTFTLIPALLVAGVALLLVFRTELGMLARQVPALRAPRLQPKPVKAPAEAAEAQV